MKFQDDISNKNTHKHTHTHTYGQAETNMSPTFSKLGAHNYDGLESQMLHTKFSGNQPAGSGEEDF